jgi:hypothetical protein
MTYKLIYRNNPHRSAYLHAWNGLVVKTTPSLDWAILKNIDWVLAWADNHEIYWRVVEGKIFRESKMSTAESRRIRAIEALKTIANGEARAVRKSDTCSHGQYGYEDCENCICEYATEVLIEIGENKP